MTVRDKVVAGARRWLGTPYDWGGEGLDGEGVDCSGLVIAAYRAAGVPLKGRPVAADLGKMGREVSLAQAQPGDVVYYDEPGPTDHVGVYAGGGRMIDAPYTGASVREDPVGKPTSIRRLLTGSDQFAGVDTSGSGDADGPLDTLTSIFVPGFGLIDKAVPGVGVDASTSGWAGEALAIGLKLTGTFAALALIVAGAIKTVQDDKEPTK